MTPKKRVLNLVLNNFKHDSRVLKESIALTHHDFDVAVVALHENLLAEREIVHDISVHRIKLISRGWPKIKAVQILKYVEFVIRVLSAYRRFDIIHCNDLNTLPVGVLIKLASLGNARLVYDAHEYEINQVPNQSELSIKCAYFLEKHLIKYADRVITVSNSIANEYQRLYGIPKPSIVLNCPPFYEAKKTNHFRKKLGIRDDQIIFLYQGGLNPGRGIEVLLDAFGRLQDDKNVIVFMGYGSLERHIQQNADRSQTIFIHPAVSFNVLLGYTASADYGISVIEDVCLSYRYCLPNKLFEYLMAGIPVIASNSVEMARVVKEYQIGVVADENTCTGFLDAFKRILAMDYKQLIANVNEARRVFNWEEQEIILLGAYNEL
jgi:glycosyltransferase involved in cell wall biosynthesis